LHWSTKTSNIWIRYKFQFL